MYQKAIKRLLDVVLSGLALVILSPLFALIAVLVRMKMGSPVLFSQRRIGKDEKAFTLHKFRSMTDAKDEEGKLLPERERLTRFGIFLRSTSLDELPELLSILKGEMSFIGPRPLPTYYGPYFLPEERKRHTVRGGLIPPDSIGGLTVSDWETQFSYETYYAEHVSFGLDVKVILTTFKILIDRMRTDYGAVERPHLNQYRAEMQIPTAVIQNWNHR